MSASTATIKVEADYLGNVNITVAHNGRTFVAEDFECAIRGLQDPMIQHAKANPTIERIAVGNDILNKAEYEARFGAIPA